MKLMFKGYQGEFRGKPFCKFILILGNIGIFAYLVLIFEDLQCSRLCIAFHGKIQYNIMIVSDTQYQDGRKSVNIDIYSERMRQQE